MNRWNMSKVGVLGLAMSLSVGFSMPRAAIAQTPEINQAIQRLTQIMGNRKVAENAKSAFESGNKLYDKGDLASLRQAVPLFQRSVKLSRAENDNEMLGLALIALGGTHSRLNETANAIAAFEEVVSLFPRLSLSPKQKQKLQIILGMLYIKNYPEIVDQNPQRARQEIEQAIPLFDAARYSEGKAYALLGLAVLQFDDEQYQDAKVNLATAIDLFRQFKEVRGEAMSLLVLGRIHIALQQPEKGLDQLKRSEQLFAQANDQESVIRVRKLIQQIQS